MITIASLIDPQSSLVIKGFWDKLENQCGLKEVKLTPFPHLSWQSAEDYDLDKLDACLSDISGQHGGFWVITSGLGIFSGEKYTLMVNVVKNKIMSDIHQQIWHHCSVGGTHVNPFHHPEFWMPHITLANKDVTMNNLPHAISTLLPNELRFDIYIDNLAILYKNNEDAGIKQIYNLQEKI